MGLLTKGNPLVELHLHSTGVSSTAWLDEYFTDGWSGLVDQHGFCLCSSLLFSLSYYSIMPLLFPDDLPWSVGCTIGDVSIGCCLLDLRAYPGVDM